jgi:O-succinylbenzoate synthase
VETERDILLVRVDLADADGAPSDTVEGWGECVALSEPSYSPEYVDGAQHVIVHHLLPRLMAAGPIEAADVAPALAKFHGHPMAKARWRWPCSTRSCAGRPVVRRRSSGPNADPDPERRQRRDPRLDRRAARRRAGLRRRRLRPHQVEDRTRLDIEQVAAVRELIGPDTPFQVDANTAYRRTDGSTSPASTSSGCS